MIALRLLESVIVGRDLGFRDKANTGLFHQVLAQNPTLAGSLLV